MSQSWPPQQGWPPQQPDESPSYGRPDTGYGYPESGYGAPGPNSRGGGGWPPQQDDGRGAGEWPPSQYPQGPYQGGPYQQGPNSQGLYQPGPYQQGPNSQGLYQPGGYVPGGYQQGPYAQDPYGQYANNPYGQPVGYGAPPAPAPRRSGNWLLPLVIVVLAILVVGGGVYTATHIPSKNPPSTTQGTATTVAPGSVPPGFKQHTDDASHTEIALPQDWTTSGTVTSSSGFEALSPDHNSVILLGSLDAVGSLEGGANGAIAGPADGGNVTNKVGPTNVSLAGETWVQEAGDITRQGTPLRMMVLVGSHGDKTYFLALISTRDAFESANTQYFQPATQSFKFTA